MTFFLEVILLGLVLSVDSFSAAVAMGSRPYQRKDALKFALLSAGAEALFAAIGGFAGVSIVAQFSEIDHWVAFILLAGVALHMVYEGWSELRSPTSHDEPPKEFHGILKLILVSFATSLDAFGVGVGLGIAQKPMIPFVISIAFFAFVSTLAGLFLGSRLSRKFGPIMSLIGALVLGIMSIQMLKI